MSQEGLALSSGPATQGHWALMGPFLSPNLLFASKEDALPGPLQVAQVTRPCKV